MLKTKLFKQVFNIFLFVSFLMVLTSCYIDESPKIHTVTFEVNDQVVAEVEVKDGQTIKKEEIPTDPVVENFVFAGWYNGEEAFSVDKVYTENVTYEAKFIEFVTIKFVVNGEEVDAIKLEKGQKMEDSDVPADPVVENFVFAGWYNGEEALSVDKVYTENVTYEAKFIGLVTIKFVVNGEEVKTLVVEEGKQVDILDVPADPTQKAYKFVGWFDGEEEFDEMEKVSTNKTYVAKFEKSHYIINFKNNDEVVEILVGVNESLSMGEIVNPIKDNAYFAGWYAEDICATEGMSLTADITFEPKFITTESFNGTWHNEDGDYFIIENGKVVGGDFGKNGQVFAFNIENGKLEYESDGFYLDESVFEITTKGIKYNHEYYDGTYEEFVTETIELVIASESKYEGTYRADNSSIITIVEGGVITQFNGSVTFKGIIKEVEGKLVISYMTSEYYGVETINVEFDEFGNLVANNAIYVKNPTNYSYKYYSYNYPTFNFFEVNDTIVVTVKENNVYYYGSVEGVVEIDEIITVTYNEKTLTVKVVGNTSYEIAGEELGVYATTNGTITLNGFGDAVVIESDNTENKKYVINGAGNLVIGEKGYALNKEEMTCTELVKDDVETGKYVYSENAKYTLMLDGFGGADLYYTSSYSSEYHGKYVLNGNTIVISNCQSYANGTWTIEENGNVLVNAGKVYLLEGATFEDISSKMDGTYGENGEILVDSASKTIKYNGETYTLTYNYNGSKATFEIKHTDSYEGWYEAEFTDVLTISLTAEDKLSIETKHYTWDEYGEGATYIITTEEFAKYVSNEKDAFAGTWVGKNSYSATITIVINGDGTGTYNDGAFTYTISGNKLSFEYNYEEYSLNGDPSTGKLTVMWTYDYSDMPEFDVEKQATEDEEENTLDAFAGTWVGKNSYSATITIVINGDGTGTYNDGAFTYTISGNKLSFEYNYEEYSLNGDPSTGKLTVMWTYDYSDMPEFDVEKQATEDEEENTLDAFAGTWVGKNSYSATITIVINGDGTGTYNDGAFTYTISGNKLSFEYNYEEYSLNGDPSTGKLTVMWTYDYSDMPEFDVEKQ